MIYEMRDFCPSFFNESDHYDGYIFDFSMKYDHYEGLRGWQLYKNWYG